MVQDLATQWIQAYPCKNKTSHETQRSLQKFLEPERKPKVIYTDNSLEFGKACEDLSWNHCTSTPHRSETNGIAGRAVRRLKEGTSAVLLQSGLNESWWADSMECYTYLRIVPDLLSDGKTPYERRFGQPLKGPIIPFGSLVENQPITAKDQSRIHQFGKKVLPGLFLGYALYVGGNLKGDVLIADLEELETMDASEIYSKRLNAKEVIFPKQGEFIFPIADGRIKTRGGDQELRTSTLIRPRPIQGEGHVDFLGESEGSLPQPHERSPNAPKFEDRSQEETEWQELGAREAAWKLAKNVFKFKEHERATFFSPPENRCLLASTLKPEEREFVVDSGASMHMISKKDSSDAEMDTLTKSCSPTIVITANGEVQTHEEAIVYVKELDIFLTMKVLEKTPAVLSLGKLCDENWYSYEWINGRKPHLIKDGIRIICNTETFVLVVVPGLSRSSSASSSTSRTLQKTGESFFFIFSIFTFFTYSRRNVGSRKGRCT